MDGVGPTRGRNRGSHAQHRPVSRGHHAMPPKKERHAGEKYWLVRSIGKVAGSYQYKLWHRFKTSSFAKWPSQRLFNRIFSLSTAVLLFVSIVAAVLQPIIDQKPYKLTAAARELLPKQNPTLAQLLKFDEKEQKFTYNEGYTGSTNPDNGMSSTGSARINASFGKQPKTGVSVTDPLNKTSITLVPKFKMSQGKQDQNQMVYRLANHDGYVVYSARTVSIKEDIVLESSKKDTADFAYELQLPNGLESKLESNGSIGIYGVSSALLGNVATATEQDQQLLEKARDNSAKTQLLFSIPAPVIIEGKKQLSTAKAHYKLKNNVLTIKVEGLINAKYPLSIDPTVYVDTAAKLMKGNNETNTDFDVENELIQKSQTTGARINGWTSTNNLSVPAWGQGTAVAGGYIYVVGGGQGSVVTTTTYYSAGTSTYSVPAGVTSIAVKVWGAGGGGGAGSGGSGSGGAGGGGGYVKSILSVTPGESLDILVGTGGIKGASNNDAGAGGGYSAVKRSSTFLLQAGGGGGGGGSSGNGTGGAGGAGGGASGAAGGSGTGGGGSAGTTGAGGAGGSAGGGGSAGAAGIANAGGNGGTSGTGGAGGTGAGGSANGTIQGGGGGGGRYGGGGGGSTANTLFSANRTGGAGGGGSDIVTGTGTVETAGSGQTPGNSSDSERNGAGQGGGGGNNSASASAGAAGGVVVSYTTTGPATSSSVYWAKFNPNTGAIESPNPGTGVCSGWCTNSAYNLPASLKGLSLVAYNGFLYALGGIDSGGNRVNTVYVAKLGATGEPQLWHPTGGTPAFWYQSNLNGSTAKAYFAAVTSNNRLYIVGGETNASPNGITTVEKADILPTGALDTWTTTGMQALPAGAGTHMHSIQVYNDVLYTIGGFEGAGTSSSNLRSAVYYSKLNVDGTMNSWQQTSSFSAAGARATMGGNFATIWGGYIYLGGGCTAVNGSGYCTTIANDVVLASINADGSLSEWNIITGLTNQRMGHTFIAWQGGLYRLGGCRNQDAGAGDCIDTVFDVDYGIINQDGEASTVATSVASGNAPCTGSTPYSCNLPNSVGNVLNATAIVNGYLYIMGGCTNNACTTVSNGITYQAIGTDGTLQRPSACTGTYVDSYCDSSVSLPVGLAAAATTIFNNRIYLVGGFNTNSNIYHVAINTDGSVGTWQNVDLTTIGAADVTYAYAYARTNPSSAGSNPGNLFIFGGCTDGSVGCSGYSEGVYKCNINTSGVPGSCSTSGQLQIGTVTGNDGSPAGSTGLGAMAGAVYANYIYLIGGLAPGGNGTDLKITRYAKFDNSNNVVAVSGSAWIEGSNQLDTGRRRGAGFGYNGYLYVVGGYEGSDGVLPDIEFTKINVSDGSWDAWSTSTVTINQRWGLSVPVSNSYAYVIGGCTVGDSPSGCTTRTSTIQTFQIYNNNSGTTQSFTPASDDTFVSSLNRWGGSAAILNGYIYYAGGCVSNTDCTSAVANVQYASISPADGSIGTWVSATYALGNTGSGGVARTWGKLLVVSGYLYYVGGQDPDVANAKSEVYYVQPAGTGNINSPWAQTTKGIGDTGSGAISRTKFGAAVWNNRIYVVGGLNSAGSANNTIYISPQLSSGGDISSNWTSDADTLSVARYGLAMTAYANNLYVIGGNDGTNYLSDTQFTQINSDGTIDAWKYSTGLPLPLSEGEAFAANGYMYIVGGRSSASTCAPKTLIAPISANTTIATGNNPTGVGEWYETNVKYAGGRYGGALAHTGGKFYLLGGGCTSPQAGTYGTGTISQSTTTVTGSGTSWTDNYVGGTVTYQDASTATIVRVVSTTQMVVGVSKTVGAGQTYSITVPRHSFAVLKAQPQIAKYSRMIDAGKDVFPTVWLMNGIDNSIGARWQFSYSSMNDPTVTDSTKACGGSAMSNYGQRTNYGDVTLGQPGAYTVKNSGGTNVSCGRYFYLSISIDASQTYGYPEDVQRGPTLSDISLFFQSSPGKRLIHGKTFIEGTQQPLDTQCRTSNPVDVQGVCPNP